MMNGSFTKNFFLKLASLVIAVILWLYVQEQSTVSHPSTFGVKLTLPDPPNGTVIVGPRTYTITIKATGPREVRPDEYEKLTATVNLDEAVVGRNVCRIQINPPSGLVRGWEWDSNPKAIVVMVDQEKSAQRNISLKTRGLQPANLIYIGATMNPKEVTIRGAKSEVDSVAQVRAILDLTLAQPASSIIVKLEALDSKDRPVAGVYCSPSEVAVLPTLIPAPTRKNLIIMPIWKGQPAIGFRLAQAEIEPNQIVVSGRSEDLAKLVSVETEPIDIDGLSSSAVLQTTLKIPPGIKSVGPTVVKVRVTLERVEGG